MDSFVFKNNLVRNHLPRRVATKSHITLRYALKCQKPVSARGERLNVFFKMYYFVYFYFSQRGDSGFIYLFVYFGGRRGNSPSPGETRRQQRETQEQKEGGGEGGGNFFFLPSFLPRQPETPPPPHVQLVPMVRPFKTQRRVSASEWSVSLIELRPISSDSLVAFSRCWEAAAFTFALLGFASV